MKPCFYCNGRKQTLIPDVRGFIVKCEKCGAEIQTPNMTIDNARGYWNMKMSASREYLEEYNRAIRMNRIKGNCDQCKYTTVKCVELPIPEDEE